MQNPVQRVQLPNKDVVFTYPNFVRASILSTWDEIKQPIAINASISGIGDPILSVPPGYSAYKSSEIHASISCGALIDSGTWYIQFRNAFVGAINSESSTGIYIDGINSQVALSGDRGVIEVQRIPESIDFSTLAALLIADPITRTTVFPVIAGSVHRVVYYFNVKVKLKYGDT